MLLCNIFTANVKKIVIFCSKQKKSRKRSVGSAPGFLQLSGRLSPFGKPEYLDYLLNLSFWMSRAIFWNAWRNSCSLAVSKK